MNEYYDEEYRDIAGSEDGPIPLSRRIWLSWEDLRFSEPKERGVWGLQAPQKYRDKLRSIWGGAGPGEMVAILGESQSGKSLILKILAGIVALERGDQLKGRVLVNGYQRGERWRRMCILVSQSSEEYHGLLTVEEQLEFRTRLSLPARWTPNRRAKVVDWALEALGLNSERKVLVDRLGHCGRRRLAIALALVGLPRVLLLDEPMEGLDPSRALELMKSLKRITAQRQMTTILTAKQVRQASIPLIDRILLLAEGVTIYYGTFSGAPGYFETHLRTLIPEKGDNPLTCMLDAISCMECRRDPNHLELMAQQWEAYAREHQLHRTNYPYDQSNDHVHFNWHRGWFAEFREQLGRSWKLFFRNRTYWVGQTALALTLALLVAFSAFQVGSEDEDESTRAILTVLYYTSVFFQFFPFIPFLFVCYRDKWVLRRERRDSLVRVSPVYISNWLLIYSFRLVIVTLYSCIVYFIVGLRLPFNYTLVFWLALLAEAWVAMGMGYLIVTLIESIAVAETLASFLLLLCIWYSGDFAYNPECTWILRWLAYLSPIFYAFNALVNNQFGGTFSKGKEVIQKTGLDNYGVWPSIGTLLGFGLVYMIFGYLALSFSTRSNRHYSLKI